MIRLATLDDAAALAALSIEVWVGTYLRQGVGSGFAEYVLGAFTPAKMQAQISDPRQIVLVSENIDGIDGYIRVALDSPAPNALTPSTEIATLYVQPRHHGRGLGQKLMQAAVADCRPRAIPALWVATNSENTPAIRFYIAAGFTPAGQTAFHLDGQDYPNDVFVLPLSP